MSNISITNAIRTILLDNEGIAESLKQKDSAGNPITDDQGNFMYNIFPLFAPDGTIGNFLLYKREEFDLERSKMGIAQEKCKIIINVISPNYEESQTLAELIYSALEHDFTSPAKIDVKLTDSAEDVDSIKDTSGVACVRYVQILYFTIK